MREIPGDYGLPIIGAIKDRYDFLYFQGQDEFFKSRMKKYNSTVFRTNMLPVQFNNGRNAKVIVLLDAVSFPVLFDVTKVEKRDVFVNTYMPSTSFTGGYRTCAYLDPSEPKHTQLKQLFLSLLASRHDDFIPEFQSCLSKLFDNMETNLSSSKNKEADFNALDDNMCSDYFFQLFFNVQPKDTKLGTDAPKLMTKWLVLQLHPLITLGLPKLFSWVDDLLLHTFLFPFFLVKSDYQKIYDVIYSSSTSILDEAEKLGITREEACHNLVFTISFNAFGATKVFFPNLMKWVALGGEKLHKDLANEIRTTVKSEGGVNYRSIEKMTLTKSVVYEALRLAPPVPNQFATAKEDLVIHSHDSSFQVKKGELLLGFQPFATRDPKIFEDPEEFKGSRFVGEEGEKLLKYVYWSNGREIANPTVVNKQCPAKNQMVLLARVMLIEFFLRYDTFTADVGTLLLGSSVKIKSLTRAETS
ncbi:hypothetical protein MKW94_016495 [Papaver nudicaule]|uniref:Allene oxide synthase n=1 Tax=Papaver nudicaule TaxID=74823 RepID=A0AA41W290_PAPNU|nr:hypothetical protein [Papaver nudicaule]